MQGPGPSAHTPPPSLQAEAAVAAVAVADTVRDGVPPVGPGGTPELWGRGGACAAAPGPSAAASFFVRYVLWLGCGSCSLDLRPPRGTAASLWRPVAGRLCQPPLLASQGTPARSRGASRSKCGIQPSSNPVSAPSKLCSPGQVTQPLCASVYSPVGWCVLQSFGRRREHCTGRDGRGLCWGVLGQRGPGLQGRPTGARGTSWSPGRQRGDRVQGGISKRQRSLG